MDTNLLLKKMTLEEKIGQLTLGVGDLFHTGPTGPVGKEVETKKIRQDIRAGRMGGLVNVKGVRHLIEIQKDATNHSRLSIPLIFGVDVIHGCFVQFPIPLAESASWDLEAIQKSCQSAAKEASATGIHWTFAPMVDICHDPRWGRIAEGAGEDPYLGSIIAKTRVKGFQGDRLDSTETVAACAKHFIAYGYSQAGRDYNIVDTSERVLRETILPPFQSAIQAKCATIMSSFNVWEGRPVSAHPYLMQTLLRKENKFKGMIVSDWQSTIETLTYGTANNTKEAAQQCLTAGIDMEMMGFSYRSELENLVKEGIIKEELIDQSTLRILNLKKDLGLFKDPFAYLNEKREKQVLLSKEIFDNAHDVAKRCIVLLRNDLSQLPLTPPKFKNKKIGLIGPLAHNKKDVVGTWYCFADFEKTKTIYESLQETYKKSDIIYEQGCHTRHHENDTILIQKALKNTKKCDHIIVVLGEDHLMSGESACRTELNLPGQQEFLLKELRKVHPKEKITVIVGAGRPLCFSEWMDKNISQLMFMWALGSQTGPAITDVLSGQYNPSAKLPVSFPRNVGQIPLSYHQYRIGRLDPENTKHPKMEPSYVSRYIDSYNTPLYAFGYGLSYSTFNYHNLTLNKNEYTQDETIFISVEVKNTSKVDGEEIVQLYIEDTHASITRPSKQLKGFKKLFLPKESKKIVSFQLKKEDLSFFRFDSDIKKSTPWSQLWGVEKGQFNVFVGSSSLNKDLLKKQFYII